MTEQEVKTIAKETYLIFIQEFIDALMKRANEQFELVLRSEARIDRVNGMVASLIDVTSTLEKEKSVQIENLSQCFRQVYGRCVALNIENKKLHEQLDEERKRHAAALERILTSLASRNSTNIQC